MTLHITVDDRTHPPLPLVHLLHMHRLGSAVVEALLTQRALQSWLTVVDGGDVVQ